MGTIYEENSKILKAVSDANRLKILDILSCGEKCACEILEGFNFTQPTLSHHMKVLIDCGLVEYRREGIWNYYKLNKNNSDKLITLQSSTCMLHLSGTTIIFSISKGLKFLL